MSRKLTWAGTSEKHNPDVPVQVPHTYSEWCDCLGYLKDSQYDKDIKVLMSKGSLSWTSGVAERFSERLALVFNMRLQECAQRLDRNISYSNDESGLITGLLSARRTLSFLHEIATLECFPELLQKHLTTELEHYAKRTQSSLENSASRDRTGRLLSIIKHNSILNFTKVSVPSKEMPYISQKNQPLTDTAISETSTKFKRRNFL